MIKARVNNKAELIIMIEVVKDYFDLSKWLTDDNYYFPNNVTMEFSEDHDTKGTAASRMERAKRTKEDVLAKLIEAGIKAKYIDAVDGESTYDVYWYDNPKDY